MAHTRFFGSEAEAEMEFQRMQKELGEIIKQMCESTLDEDRAMKAGSDAISKFVEQFP